MASVTLLKPGPSCVSFRIPSERKQRNGSCIKWRGTWIVTVC